MLFKVKRIDLHQQTELFRLHVTIEANNTTHSLDRSEWSQKCLPKQVIITTSPTDLYVIQKENQWLLNDLVRICSISIIQGHTYILGRFKFQKSRFLRLGYTELSFLYFVNDYTNLLRQILILKGLTLQWSNQKKLIIICKLFAPLF